MGIIDRAGWKGVIKVYPNTNLRKSVRWPVIITFILFVVTVVFDCNYYEINKSLCNGIMSSLPSILGFSIAAYALILGFSANKILLELFKKKENQEPSFFQVISSTFAIMNLALLVTLFGALIGIVFLNVGFPNDWNVSMCFVSFINAVGTFLLIFLLSYSCKTLLDVIVNVFNFTQFINKQLSYVEDKNVDKK